MVDRLPDELLAAVFDERERGDVDPVLVKIGNDHYKLPMYLYYDPLAIISTCLRQPLVALDPALLCIALGLSRAHRRASTGPESFEEIPLDSLAHHSCNPFDLLVVPSSCASCPLKPLKISWRYD